MGLSTFFHLGFFTSDSVGVCATPRTLPGDQTREFEACLLDMFGVLADPQDPDALPLCRTRDGIVTLIPGQLAEVPSLAPAILELQRRTGCQILEQLGTGIYRIQSVLPEPFEWHLNYFLHEYPRPEPPWPTARKKRRREFDREE